MHDELSHFLSDTGSTTVFLESLAGRPIHAQVIAQNESKDGSILRRKTLLATRCSAPIVAAVCALRLSVLSEAELHGLKTSDAPIGRILAEQCPTDLRKDGFTLNTAYGGSLARLLDTVGSKYFSKSYRLWHADRLIGKFTEVVSAVSLSRALISARKSASTDPRI